jgi:hypothetical protein
MMMMMMLKQTWFGRSRAATGAAPRARVGALR